MVRKMSFEVHATHATDEDDHTMDGYSGPFRGYFDWLEHKCSAALIAAGLPGVFGHYIMAEGTWKKIAPSDLQLHERYIVCVGPVQVAQHLGFEHNSPEGIAAKILSEIWYARRYREEGNWDQYGNSLFKIGEAVQADEFIAEWKPLAIIGSAVSHRLPGSAAGGRKPGTKAARNARLAAEYLKRRNNSRKSDTALKVEIGAEEKLSRSQAIEAITAGLKIVSGQGA